MKRHLWLAILILIGVGVGSGLLLGPRGMPDWWLSGSWTLAGTNMPQGNGRATLEKYLYFADGWYGTAGSLPGAGMGMNMGAGRYTWTSSHTLRLFPNYIPHTTLEYDVELTWGELIFRNGTHMYRYQRMQGEEVVNFQYYARTVLAIQDGRQVNDCRGSERLGRVTGVLVQNEAVTYTQDLVTPFNQVLSDGSACNTNSC